MKTLKLITLSLVLASAFACNAQKQDIKDIKEVITLFSKAGDSNDAAKLANCLDDNYRIVMNRLFGSEAVSIMSREVYLEKIKTKEYGGDTRSLTFENVIVNGNTAVVKVIFTGKKMTFNSLISLVKDSKNQWKLISDVPIIK